MTERRFAGKVVLVTGGSSGIGRAAALAFAREGASVAIASRGAERGMAVRDELEALGAPADFFAADLSKGADVRALMQHVIQRFGRIDCALNNAATVDVGSFKALADFSEEEYDRHLASNLKSVWLCMKYEIEHMIARGIRGRIVNTSSINGLGGAAGNGLYSASKSGVLGLTKSAALEYARRDIRINALVAGGFDTPMLDEVLEKSYPANPAAAGAALSQMVPAGRIGHPAEAADAALWLCSDDASYVTGHSLIVDGGFSAKFR